MNSYGINYFEQVKKSSMECLYNGHYEQDLSRLKHIKTV
jgi:hypothetical protein